VQNDSKPRRDDRLRSRHNAPASDVGIARRRAISAIATEDVETLAKARQAAQRNLVRAVENSTSAADIHRLLSLFAIEASRDYAAHALRFDALVGELSTFASTEG
jgi:hypothetical protein